MAEAMGDPLSLILPPPAPNWFKVVKSVRNSIIVSRRKDFDSIVATNWRNLKAVQNELVRWSIPWEIASAPSPDPTPLPEGTPQPVTFAKITTFRLGHDDKAVTEEVPLVTIPAVKKNPPYSVWVWTPRNYVVPDQEERRHCPYFDEATFTEDSRLLHELDAFVNDDESIEVGDEDVFYDTVTTLHNLEKEHRQKVSTVPDDAQWNRMIQETTVVRPTPASSNFKPAAPEDLFMPSMSTFEALSKVVKSAPPDKLREKFAQLLKKWHPIIKNLHTPGINLDNDLNRTTNSAETSLDSFRQVFCRKCFLYNCPFHVHDGVAVEYITKNHLPELPAPVPCSVSCHLHDKLEDGKKHLRSRGHMDWDEKEEDRRHWGPNDISMCRVLLNVFKHNYCSIAKIMSTNCRMVQLFANTEKPKVDTSHSPPMLSSSRRKAPKVRRAVKNVYTKGVSSQELFLKTVYKPCFHPEMECTSSICTCLESQIPCEKYCTCPPNCVHRAVGCKCEGRCNTRACPCYAMQRECDPDLCCSCGANLHQIEFTTCRNIGIQRLWRKHLKMAPSDIPEAGWGTFAVEAISRGELIEEYVGELITDREADRRALEYQKRCHTFLFELNSEYSIDAQKKGSKVRFANHADKPNTFVKVMKVNTDQRIGIYASRDIQPNEELYLDYKRVIEEHKAVKLRKTGVRRRRYPSKTVLARRISLDF